LKSFQEREKREINGENEPNWGTIYGYMLRWLSSRPQTTINGEDTGERNPYTLLVGM
jgi:hypothetical protein